MRWTLADYLERHNLNANQVAMRASLSPNTVYPMARGDMRRVDLKSLEAVLLALRDMSGEQVRIGDLLELEDKREADAPWEALSGILDALNMPSDGAVNHDRYLDEALAEEHRGVPQTQR